MVKVDGRITIDLGTKIEPDALVTINGDPISHIIQHRYIILNKPKDYITTTSDEQGRKTVMDLINVSVRVFPVGRLDRNTTGLLLLTNDGELANRLMHPKYEVEKVYEVGLNKNIDFNHCKEISEGIELEDGKTSPCELFVNTKDHTQVTISIKEGKNREVRRMFEAFGYEVKKLHRKFYANLNVSGLLRGKYRYLTREEISHLKRLVGL